MLIELFSVIYKSSVTEGSYLDYETTKIIKCVTDDELNAINKMKITSPKSQLYMRKEALQYNNAYKHAHTIINDTVLFPSDIWFIQLHHILMTGLLHNMQSQSYEPVEVGKYRNNEVYTSIRHMPPKYVYDSMIKLIRELNDMYNEFKMNSNLSIRINIACNICATFMIRYLLIHPFDDGNGRISRIVSDYILQKCLNIDYYLDLTKNKKMRERFYKIVKYSNTHPIDSTIQVMKDHIIYTLHKQSNRINNMFAQMCDI